jgi:acyl-CoA reductase-like NAD-dependent aldehyde dehydrogenase
MTLQQPTDTLDVQVINPATRGTLAHVPRGGPDDVAEVEAAAEDVKSVIIDGRA